MESSIPWIGKPSFYEKKNVVTKTGLPTENAILIKYEKLKSRGLKGEGEETDICRNLIFDGFLTANVNKISRPGPHLIPSFS